MVKVKKYNFPLISQIYAEINLFYLRLSAGNKLLFLGLNIWFIGTIINSAAKFQYHYLLIKEIKKPVCIKFAGNIYFHVRPRPGRGSFYFLFYKYVIPPESKHIYGYFSQCNDAGGHQMFVANYKILSTDAGQGSHKTTNFL